MFVIGISQNIGARRLHTVMEKLLEDVSFDAPYDDGARTIKIDRQYVESRLADLVRDKDVTGYIL